MQVQEFDDLANWFKKNVLDIQNLDDDITGLDEYEDSSRAETVEQVNEQDDELSLFEYIIGIDGFES